MKQRKTKAIVFEGIQSMSIRDIPLPETGEKEILVKVLKSGVSVGTERWALEGKRPEIRFPSVPGYLAVGRIIETGSRVDDFKAGDMVNFSSPRLPEPYSINSWMGTHISSCVVNVDLEEVDAKWGMPYCVKIDGKDFSEEQLESLSMAGLAGVACRGIEMCRPAMGDNVLIVGLGFIGQMAAQILKLKGCNVTGVDILDKRVELARKYSVDCAISSKGKELAEAVREHSCKEFDIIIDTTGSGVMLDKEIELLKRWGKMVWQGWYPGATKVDFNKFHIKLPTVYMPCAHSGKNVSVYIRWIMENRLTVYPLITHHVQYTEAPKTYEMILAHPEEFMGIVFDWEDTR